MGKLLDGIKAIAQEHGHNFAGIEDVEAWCREQRGKPASDHIADADKKVQPSRCPHCGYTPGVIPSDFDAYAQANCEHRESHAKPAPAPLPSYTFDSHTHALKFIAASLTDLGGEQEALDTVCAHLSDLTRRLAEAERDKEARNVDALREALKDLLAASHPVIHRGRHACAGRVRAKRLARVAIAATEAK